MCHLIITQRGSELSSIFISKGDSQPSDYLLSRFYIESRLLWITVVAIITRGLCRQQLLCTMNIYCHNERLRHLIISVLVLDNPHEITTYRILLLSLPCCFFGGEDGDGDAEVWWGAGGIVFVFNSWNWPELFKGSNTIHFVWLSQVSFDHVFFHLYSVRVELMPCSQTWTAWQTVCPCKVLYAVGKAKPLISWKNNFLYFTVATDNKFKVSLCYCGW